MYLLLGIPTILIIFKLCISYSSLLARLICLIFLRQSKQEAEKHTMIRDLYEELQDINAPSEPARYIKIERRMNKMKDGLGEIDKKRKWKQMIILPATKLTLYLIQVMVMVSIVVVYRHDPIYSLPLGWFTPIEYIIAFPSGVTGGVGLTFWTLVSAASLNKLQSVVFS